MLRKFLRLEDPEAPLYGRHRREIFLERFTVQQAIGFLKAGSANSAYGSRGPSWKRPWTS